jgi:glutamate dehydrogenase
VSGIYRKLGLDETQVRKLQIGGPGGDLSFNEILLGGRSMLLLLMVLVYSWIYRPPGIWMI